MRSALAAIALAIAATAAVALAQPADRVAAGKAGFLDVMRVLSSPRCMNCHPAGDRPLQGDDSHPHTQNISRRTTAAGVPCSTCHQARGAEALGVEHGPPGAPGWNLPPAETPMVFQGRTAARLCQQLKDPAQNGGKNLAQLLDHVTSDPLVRWGWAPGKGRTLPPLSHERFVAAFKAWVDSGAACP